MLRRNPTFRRQVADIQAWRRSPPAGERESNWTREPGGCRRPWVNWLQLGVLFGSSVVFAVACSETTRKEDGGASVTDAVNDGRFSPGDAAPGAGDALRGPDGVGPAGAGGHASGGAGGAAGAIGTGGTGPAGVAGTGGSPTGGFAGTRNDGSTGATETGGSAGAGAVGTGGLPDAGGASGSGGRNGRDGSTGDVGSAAGDAGATDVRATDVRATDAGAIDAGAQAPGGTIGSYGNVYFTSSTRTQIVRLQTTLIVPPQPPASGTLFLWPGLQPLTGSANFQPINTGVLQPVLTWGNSCAPGTQPRAYSTWWISAQYVNTNGSVAGYTGCSGGPVMTVAVGDQLNIDMELAGTVWNQTVTDGQTGTAVAFSKDMAGQAQNWALFSVEEYSSAPVSGVTFMNTVITYGASDAAHCKLDTRGPNDFVSVPQASSDGLQCSIEEIVLRAKGISD